MSFKGVAISLLVAVLLVLLLPPVFGGDRDVAELLFEKGEKAYKKRDYDGAADYFQRALDEFPAYPEAALGLAQALEKAGKGPEALRAYLRCKDECAKIEKPTRKQKKMCDQAERAIGKLGAGYAELEKLDAAFVKSCLTFSRKYLRPSPAWAKKALEAAHEIDPANSLVISTLDRVEDAGDVGGGAGLYEALIKDDALTEWDPGCKKGFTCLGGIVSADTPADGGISNVIRTRFEGSWSMKATFRVLEKKGLKISHGLMFGRRPDGSAWGLLIDWDASLALVRWGGDDGSGTVVFRKLPAYRADRWHQIRVDVEGGKVTGYFNGDKSFTHEEADGSTFDGMPAIFVQRGRFEFKDVGVKK
jgi:tetratricopeptide (TPR) repeat protein